MISDVDIIVYTMYNRKARKMVLNMKASDFDTDGFYSPGGGEQLCLLGITMDFSPRFLRRYLNLAEDINNAIGQYCEDVRSGDFPNENESYSN